MIEAAAKSVRRFRSRGVLIDTNLLLLYLIGSIDQNLIANFKRTKQYRIEDFQLLTELLVPIRLLLTTPHVATEVDNWGKSLHDPARQTFKQLLQDYVGNVKESHSPAKRLCKSKAFGNFGLADAAIRHIGRNRLVITDDFPLSQYIENNGGHVVNFTNLRAYV